MLEQYNLKMPANVYAGTDALHHITGILQENEVKRVAFFTDQGIISSGVIEKPLKYIKESVEYLEVYDDLPPEPTADQVQSIVDKFKDTGADFIVAVGGGSVMDTAKLASVLTGESAVSPPSGSRRTETVRDLLEDASKARKTVKTLMIPTTAGTGAEATPNAIVAVPEKELKVGIVNSSMIADYVILDPAMVETLPKHIAAATGLDALAHAVECFTSNKANPISDTFAIRALELIMANIEEACLNPLARKEKEQMLLASFYAGVAITASGTTAVHALSYPLGGKYHIPHGISNAIMLAPVMRFNEPYCRNQFAEAYDRTAKVDETLTLEEKSRGFITRLCDIVKKLGIPSDLSQYGVDQSDLDTLVEAGMQVQRLLVNNRRTVTAEDARDLYLQVLSGKSPSPRSGERSGKSPSQGSADGRGENNETC